MSRRIVITTPEGVQLEFLLAGLGSRFMALLMDSIIQLLVVLALVLLFGLSALTLPFENASRWSIAVLVLAIFAVFDGYFLLFEGWWNGQTPGKRMVGLRVVREGGYPLDFRGAMIRNLVRLVDMLPGMYAVGVLFILFDSRNRRLGDVAAGTLVVREREETTNWQTAASGYTWRGVSSSSASPNDSVVLPVEALSHEHFDLAETFLRRRVQLDPRLRVQMGEQIAGQLRQAMGITAEQFAGSAERLLETVVSERARRAGL